ncbi:hypothetical protein RvY_14391 [Ramazzottius varieornatus]|uniref:Uncharacterized protein n=1 Tax=Ramazzottius varieornatus TaxID=947166 RepID=A0A1D1VR61_RAMVA|nr:hypothetical protein RvY_14391 [Ramazzottius varieornatus]
MPWFALRRRSWWNSGPLLFARIRGQIELSMEAFKARRISLSKTLLPRSPKFFVHPFSLGEWRLPYEKNGKTGKSIHLALEWRRKSKTTRWSVTTTSVTWRFKSPSK